MIPVGSEANDGDMTVDGDRVATRADAIMRESRNVFDQWYAEREIAATCRELLD